MKSRLGKSAIIIREIQFMIRMSNPAILQQFHLRISRHNCSHELIKIIMYMDAKSLHMHMWKLWIASILHLLIHNSNWHLMTPGYSARPINRQKNLFGPLPCHTVYHYSIITPTIRVGGHLRAYKTIQGRLTTIDLRHRLFSRVFYKNRELPKDIILQSCPTCDIVWYVQIEIRNKYEIKIWKFFKILCVQNDCQVRNDWFVAMKKRNLNRILQMF